MDTISKADLRSGSSFWFSAGRLIRESLGRLLHKQSGITVVGSDNESAAAFKELMIRPCDVLLLDSVETLAQVVACQGRGQLSRESRLES